MVVINSGYCVLLVVPCFLMYDRLLSSHVTHMARGSFLRLIFN
jgi:hypothetical protein